MVRMANARIWWSLTKQLKNETVDGLPGGCLNASAGSAAFVQYSSSHSVGRSMSKLCGVGKWETKAHRRDVSRRLRCSKPHVGQRNKGLTYSSSWIAHGRPRAKLVPRSIATRTLHTKTKTKTKTKTTPRENGERRADSGPSGYVVNVGPMEPITAMRIRMREQKGKRTVNTCQRLHSHPESREDKRREDGTHQNARRQSSSSIVGDAL